ncbi:hypothetical protein CPAR01_00537, partial [Colletotrichum paranaense]
WVLVVTCIKQQSRWIRRLPTLGAVRPICRGDLGIFPGKFGQSAPPPPRPETPMSAAAQLHFPRW